MPPGGQVSGRPEGEMICQTSLLALDLSFSIFSGGMRHIKGVLQWTAARDICMKTGQVKRKGLEKKAHARWSFFFTQAPLNLVPISSFEMKRRRGQSVLEHNLNTTRLPAFPSATSPPTCMDLKSKSSGDWRLELLNSFDIICNDLSRPAINSVVTSCATENRTGNGGIRSRCNDTLTVWHL